MRLLSSHKLTWYNGNPHMLAKTVLIKEYYDLKAVHSVVALIDFYVLQYSVSYFYVR